MNLVYGQHQLCGLVSCAGNNSGSSLQSTDISGRSSTNSRLTLLARLSSKSKTDVGRVSSNRHEAEQGALTSAHRSGSYPSVLGSDPVSYTHLTLPTICSV